MMVCTSTVVTSLFTFKYFSDTICLIYTFTLGKIGLSIGQTKCYHKVNPIYVFLQYSI